MDKRTVEKYIQLLEKAFIVLRLNSFSGNLRNVLKKSRKIFFYDNGIRNAVIGRFSLLASRNDGGALWENYLVSERQKRNHFQAHFWRTTAQQEIDYIEEHNGQLHACEFKWNSLSKRNPFTKTYVNQYHPSSTEVVTPSNYLDFLSHSS